MTDKPNTKRVTDEMYELGRIDLLREEKLHKWLESRGWRRTSATPGSFWMWFKEWDGKTFMVNDDTAERIQRHFDAEEDFRQHPEEYED